MNSNFLMYFIIYLFLSINQTQQVELNDLQQIYNNIYEKDKKYKSDIITQLENKKSEIIRKIKDNSNCFFNATKCMNEINWSWCNILENIKVESTPVKINNEINKEKYYNLSICTELKNVFDQNKKVVNESIINIENIIEYLKKNIKERKESDEKNEENKEKDNMKKKEKNKLFIQINNNSSNHENNNEDNNESEEESFFNDMISSMGHFFSNTLIQTESKILIEKLDRNFEKKLNNIKDKESQINYLEKTLSEFIEVKEILTDKKRDLFKVFNKSIKRCFENRNPSLNEIYDISSNENLTFQNKVLEESEDFYDKAERICNIQKDRELICKQMNNFCDKIKIKYEHELADLEDLIYYFK